MWGPEAQSQGGLRSEGPEPESSTCDEASDSAEPLFGPVGRAIDDMYSWATASLSLIADAVGCRTESSAAGEEEEEPAAPAAAAAAGLVLRGDSRPSTSRASSHAEAGRAPPRGLPAAASRFAQPGAGLPESRATSSDVPPGQVVASSSGALSPGDAWQRFWEAAVAVWTAQLEQLQGAANAAPLFQASESLLRAQIPLITVTTMGTVYFCFAGVYMHVLLLPLASVSSVAFHIPLFMSLLSYHKVVVTDPGHIPASWKSPVDVIANYNLKLRVERCTTERKRKDPSELRYCRKEGTYKPDRAHYCKEVRRNVLRMDHWTPWLGKCVGFYNHKFFILFLLYSSVASNVAWTHMGWALIAKSLSGAHFCALCSGSIMSFFVAALTTPYLGFQCFLLGVNSTSVEFWEKDASWWRSPYDRGFTSNVSGIMGHPVLWLLPFGTPPTAGIEFVVAQRSRSDPRRTEPPAKIKEVPEVSHKMGPYEPVGVAKLANRKLSLGRGAAAPLATWAAGRRGREPPQPAPPGGLARGDVPASFIASVGGGAPKRPSNQDFITFTGLVTPAAATGTATDPKGSSNFQKHPSREASFITYRSPSAVAKPPGQARSSQQISFRLPGEGSPFSAQKQRRSSTGAMAIGTTSRNLKSPMSRQSLSGTSTTRRVGFAALSEYGKQEVPRRRDSTRMIRAVDPAPARADEANWRARPTDTASQASTVSSQADTVYSPSRGRAATSFLSSNSPVSQAKARSVRMGGDGAPALVSQAETAPGGNVAAPPTLLDVIAYSSTAASSAAPAASTSDPVRSSHNDCGEEANSANFTSPLSPRSRAQAGSLPQSSGAVIPAAEAGSLPQSSGAVIPAAEEIESSDAALTNVEENPYEDMDGPFCYGNFITNRRRGKVTTAPRWADMEDEQDQFGEEDTSFVGWENVFEKNVLDDMSYPSASDAPYHGHAQAMRRYPGPDSEEDGEPGN